MPGILAKESYSFPVERGRFAVKKSKNIGAGTRIIGGVGGCGVSIKKRKRIPRLLTLSPLVTQNTEGDKERCCFSGEKVKVLGDAMDIF